MQKMTFIKLSILFKAIKKYLCSQKKVSKKYQISAFRFQIV